MLPWTIWALGALFYGYGFFHRVAPSVMIDELMAEFAVGAAIVGNLSAIYFWSYSITQLPTGILVDRFGPRRVLIGAATLAGLGSLLFAAQTNLWVAYLGRLLMGLGVGVSWVSAAKLSATWFPPRRFALLLGLTTLIGGLGAIMGQAPLAAAIQLVGWRTTMIGAGLLGLGFAAAFAALVRDSPNAMVATGRSPDLFHGLIGVLSKGHNWLLAALSMSLGAQLFAFASLWGVPFLAVAHGLTRAEAAGATSLMLLGWALGSVAWGWISDRISRRKLPVMVSAAGCPLILTVVIYVPGLPFGAVEVLLPIAGFFFSGIVCQAALAREHNSPEHVGTAIAFINMGVMVSGAISQAVTGWLIELSWDGHIVGGIPVYSAGAYQVGFLYLMVSGVIATVIATQVRETYARQVG